MRVKLILLVMLLMVVPWSVDAQFKGEIVGQGVRPLRNRDGFIP